jgi:catechol 2,3-dioxygenase-like lactoylglutathione lyase family enzyme
MAARHARRYRADIGRRTFNQLDDLLAADGIALTGDERARLEAPAGPTPVYPQGFLLEQNGIGDVRPSCDRAEQQLVRLVRGAANAEPTWHCEALHSIGISRRVEIRRAVPNIRSDRPAETRDFFVDLFGFEVAMDLGWVMTVVSPSDPSAQITIVGGDDPAAPGISVEVGDVDAVHARAVERGFEIAYSLRDEEWGVRRFMLRDPNGTVVNVLSHLPGERQG